MQQFNNLSELYGHLEEHAADYRDTHQIAELFQRVRDLKFKEGETDEARQAQWEIDCFNFNLDGRSLKWMFTTSNTRGETEEYPTLAKFDATTYKHIQNRLAATANAVLKTRYAHVLWCSPHKHRAYAEAAIDGYLSLIGVYENNDKLRPDDVFAAQVLQVAKSSCSLARQSRYGIDETKAEVKRLFASYNPRSSWLFGLRRGLLEFMLRGDGQFTREDFAEVAPVCSGFADSLIASQDYHAALLILELGEQIDKKLSRINQAWRLRVALCNERLMENAAMSNNTPAAAEFCRDAIDNYKAAGALEKIAALEERYVEFKAKSTVSRFSTPIDLTEHVKRSKELATRVSECSPEEIIKLLTLDRGILPRLTSLEKSVAEQAEAAPMIHHMSTTLADGNNNTVQHFETEEERQNFHVLQAYSFQVRFYHLRTIHEIIVAATGAGKLSSEAVLSFLQAHSWLGKPLQKSFPSGEVMEYTWLGLIAPALHEYFEKLRQWVANPEVIPDFVLCIDSLTLKMEGLLRDMCRLQGTTTFYMGQDLKRRPITMEKDVHHLLHENAVTNLLNRDDLLFMRFLLVEKAGWNLRHEVAHCLMAANQYDLGHAHLLFIALLRLAQFNLTEKKAESPGGSTGLAPDAQQNAPGAGPSGLLPKNQ